MRLIDADAFRHRILCQPHNMSVNEVLELISAMPTADVVEKERYDRLLENSTIIAEALNKYQTADVVDVVRCKDCKHNPVTAWFGCPMAGTKRRLDDDFCSFGERRGDAEIH